MGLYFFLVHISSIKMLFHPYAYSMSTQNEKNTLEYAIFLKNLDNMTFESTTSYYAKYDI